jgi:hypothetical protein
VIDRDQQIAARLRRGVATAVELQRGVAASQPSISRALGRLGDGVVRIGRSRGTRYALRRSLPGAGDRWPVYRIDAAGRPSPAGHLHAICPDGFWFDASSAGPAEATEHGLPWFLQDLRPQGFIGRTLPQRFPDLGLPERSADWNDDQVLAYLVRRGDDTVGNLIVGEESLARHLQSCLAPPMPIAPHARAEAFAELARLAAAGAPPGSSAGGEQPKFGAVVTRDGEPCHVLVKFAPEGSDPVARRWSDLLICEQLALAAWSGHAGVATGVELVMCGQRAFLESRRFDRIGVRGRRGVVSLAALDDAFLGRRRSWSDSAQALATLGHVGAGDVETIRRAAAFGRVIANTDMHFGNLSFFHEPGGAFALAPLYDMLPMRYAPTAADPYPDTPMPAPTPAADDLPHWPATLRLGCAFWQSVAAHPAITPAFATLAERNAAVIERQFALFA